MRRYQLMDDGGRQLGRTLIWGVVLAAAVAAAAGGCASSSMVTMREVPHSPLVERLKLTASGGPQPSERTMQFLRVYDLSEDLEGDPGELLEKVQAVIDEEPSSENIYVFSELAFLGAKRVEGSDPKQAMDLYGASVLYAYRYLFDERFAYLRNPYDPQFRGACDLYNGSLEAALRIACANGDLVPGQTLRIETAGGPCEVTCEVRGSQWKAEDFERFEFVSDYQMKGLKNHYQTYGLGVPLIAVRRSYEGEPLAARYYPPNLSFPVTAFIRPDGSGAGRADDASAEGPESACRNRAVLELYDPQTTTDIAVGQVRVPLESDVTTPLAFFLSNPALGSLAAIRQAHVE